MKRTLRLVGVAAMVLLLAASCKKDEKNNGETQRMTFTAGIEQGNSKTALTPNGSHAFNQVWSEGDAINVNGTTFGLKNGANTDCAEFDGEVVPAETYYAVYPATATLNSSEVTFNLPASQTYLENSYASNLAPMAAKSTDENLSFTNLCGLMELGLKGENITVTSLELRCDKPICGQTAVYTIGGDAALAMPAEAGKTITMNCVTEELPQGVQLNKTDATSFIFVLPPVTEGDFSLKVTYVAGANTIQKTIALPENISITASNVAYNINPYELVGVNGTVTTDVVTNVTASGASVAYTVTPNGVSQARLHGICCSTIEHPVYTDNPVPGTGQSSYTASLTGLNANTTYYVRAYAIFEPAAKNEGDVVVYGDEKYFTTEQETPTTASATLNTNDVRIGPKGFWVSGTISGVSKGSAEVGVCYSHTNSDPKYADGHSTISTSASTFSVDVNGLDFGTSYYYRSYIKYNGGVAYGTPVYTLKTESATSTSGTGTVSDTYYFSVSPTKKVVFSKGNLQYNAGLNEWRFAEHQYDVLGNTNNTDPHANYPVWIDLFGYGTSGYNMGQSSYQPWSCGSTGFYNGNLTGKADWGYNKIVNGGNTEGQWHTLTRFEFAYLIGSDPGSYSGGYRTNAANKRGLATVNGVKGLVILPDNWSGTPSGCSFTATGDLADYASNKYTDAQWQQMESYGAVFLPLGGMRIPVNRFYYDDQYGSEYWFSDQLSNDRAYRMILKTENFGLTGSAVKYYCISVRLVKTY